jgi:TetR/AcrR family transcriptional repressor of nem operon
MTDKRDHLQQLAQVHVQRGGLKGLSFRTLADEAGIKSSSVHYYFPEKADLAAALIERYAEALMAELEQISGRQNWSLRRKLTAFAGIFEAVAKDDAVCLCGMLAAENDNLSDSNRKQLSGVFREMEKWLTEVFNSHSAELASPVPVLQLARSVIAGLEGALLIDRVAGNRQCFAAQKAVMLSYLA